MEDEFWEFYPNNHKPKVQDFLTILPIEYSIKSTIEYDIEEYKKNEFWQFDFDKYKAFIDVSNPIETLFNLSELLVQLDRLEMFNDFLNLDNKTIITKQQKKTSYKWQGKPDELPELYKLMIDKYKLIGPDTTLEQFRAVFTGQPIESINPIKWTSSNRLLAYFLDSAFIGVNWQSIAGNGNLFLNSNGKQLDANDLSVAKRNFIEYGKPKGYENIDLILNTIKKH
jgi:hypothetical protein